MSGRRTNLALFLLLALALLTGGMAFGVGTASGRVVVVAHGVAGLAIVLLVPWKSMIVRRGLGRGVRPGVLSSVALGLAVGVAVVSGVLFSTGANLRYGPLNAIQVHVGSALAAIPFLVQHVWTRPVRPHRVDVDRRNLLRAGGLAGVAAVAWVSLEGVSRVLRLPGRDRRFTGSHERGSFDPRAMPATQWLDDSVQRIDAGSWRLAAPGREWTVDELDGSDRVTAILDCTSGWFSEQNWTGTRLDRIVGDAPGRSIVVKSATGYRRRFPREAATDLVLATRLGDARLSASHGAPARLVAPGRRGFWWVKWVTEIVVDGRPPWWQPPFPLT